MKAHRDPLRRRRSDATFVCRSAAGPAHKHRNRRGSRPSPASLSRCRCCNWKRIAQYRLSSNDRQSAHHSPWKKSSPQELLSLALPDDEQITWRSRTIPRRCIRSLMRLAQPAPPVCAIIHTRNADAVRDIAVAGTSLARRHSRAQSPCDARGLPRGSSCHGGGARHGESCRILATMEPWAGFAALTLTAPLSHAPHASLFLKNQDFSVSGRTFPRRHGTMFLRGCFRRSAVPIPSQPAADEGRPPNIPVRKERPGWVCERFSLWPC